MVGKFGKSLIHKLALGGERLFDLLKPSRLNHAGAVPVCHLGYGTAAEVRLRGRVLIRPHLWTSDGGDSPLHNFFGMLGNFLTREVAGQRVEVSFAGETRWVTSDAEGYFEGRLPGLVSEVDWHDFSARLPGGEECRGRVLIPTAKARRLVISDIDDTVIETGAEKLWQMAKTTLLENYHTRKIFPGVGEFYRGLQAGGDGGEENPVFYVTSSPWNLREFIFSVFKQRHIPPGPAFMTDWGVDREKFFKEGHGAHKGRAIGNLLEVYAELPVVLIGDSGERDPEIYAGVVEEFGSRVTAVFIRQVSDESRAGEIRELARACLGHKVPLWLVADTEEAIGHAAKVGLVQIAKDGGGQS